MKTRAQGMILEILKACGSEGINNRTLTGKLESMGFTRKNYAPAIQSLEDSGKITKTTKASAGDTHFWRLAEQPASASVS